MHTFDIHGIRLESRSDQGHLVHRRPGRKAEMSLFAAPGLLPAPRARRQPTRRQLDREIDLEKVAGALPGVATADVGAGGRQPTNARHEGHIAPIEDPALEPEQEELSLQGGQSLGCLDVVQVGEPVIGLSHAAQTDHGLLARGQGCRQPELEQAVLVTHIDGPGAGSLGLDDLEARVEGEESGLDLRVIGRAEYELDIEDELSARVDIHGPRQANHVWNRFLGACRVGLLPCLELGELTGAPAVSHRHQRHRHQQHQTGLGCAARTRSAVEPGVDDRGQPKQPKGRQQDRDPLQPTDAVGDSRHDVGREVHHVGAGDVEKGSDRQRQTQRGEEHPPEHCQGEHRRHQTVTNQQRDQKHNRQREGEGRQRHKEHVGHQRHRFNALPNRRAE